MLCTRNNKEPNLKEPNVKILIEYTQYTSRCIVILTFVKKKPQKPTKKKTQQTEGRGGAWTPSTHPPLNPPQKWDFKGRTITAAAKIIFYLKLKKSAEYCDKKTLLLVVVWHGSICLHNAKPFKVRRHVPQFSISFSKNLLLICYYFFWKILIIFKNDNKYNNIFIWYFVSPLKIWKIFIIFRGTCRLTLKCWSCKRT